MRQIRNYVKSLFSRKSVGNQPATGSSPLSGDAYRAPVEGDVDLILMKEFFPDTNYKGIAVEIGAAKPDFLSITASFRKQGWKILSIEPNPAFCSLYRERGLDIIECACGDTDRDDVPFFVVHTDGIYLGEQVTNESFSSLGIKGKFSEILSGIPSRTTEIKVKVRRIDTILNENNIEPHSVDILSIDVEGWELEVLAGLDENNTGPKIMIVENVFDEKSYIEFIENRGYKFWKRIQPNDVFIRKDLL